MINLDQVPTDSPLSQSVPRDGKTVQVELYKNGEGGWLLEVVDEYGNSTVRDASFGSDRDTLDEAFNTIDEEGIDSLIGSPSDVIAAMTRDHPLSSAELEELDDFLGDEVIEQTSMHVSTLDGFLTAIAIGPQIVLPSAMVVLGLGHGGRRSRTGIRRRGAGKPDYVANYASL